LDTLAEIGIACTAVEKSAALDVERRHPGRIAAVDPPRQA